MMVFISILALVTLPLLLWVVWRPTPSVAVAVAQLAWACALLVGLILFNSVESYTRELVPLLVAGVFLTLALVIALASVARLAAAFMREDRAEKQPET